MRKKSEERRQGGLEGTKKKTRTYPNSHLLNEQTRVAAAAAAGLGAEVDEVVGVAVAAGAEDVALDVVQPRHELVPEAPPALRRQPPPQPPQPAPQLRRPLVRVLSWEYPVRVSGRTPERVSSCVSLKLVSTLTRRPPFRSASPDIGKGQGEGGFVRCVAGAASASHVIK